MINISVPEQSGLTPPRIVVFGAGGAGCNAVNNMIRSGLIGVEFIAANTDAQALASNLASKKLQLGVNATRGLGAGARPDVGREAAEEQLDEINAHLDGARMVFITAGMGGGTGTGAAPVIARAARERGLLTVGVVTKPFQFEGPVRMRSAEQGIQALQQHVDTLIVIPNQNLFNVANEKTTFANAFKMADDVLYQGVRSVTDLIMNPGDINLDFADICSVMSEMGKAMMGTGEAEGDNRARQAAEMAINNPLLDDASVRGARGVLINITGGPDLTLFEVEEAMDRIRDEVDPDANIIFGTALSDEMAGKIRISVVATGIDKVSDAQNNGGQSASIVPLSAATPAPAAPARSVGGMVGGLFGGHNSSAQAAPAPVQQPAAQAPVQQQQPRTATVAQAPSYAQQQPMSQPTQSVGQTFYTGMQAEQVGNTLRAPAPETAQYRQPQPQSMPSQPVRGLRQGEQFMAPAPVQAQRQPQPMPQPTATNFAAMDAQAPASQRKPSFGERMFSSVRRFVTTGDEGTQAQQHQPQPQAQHSVQQHAYAQPQHQAPQARGYEVTQGGRASLPPVEDSDIEIPSFLRRQAN